jgi:hypothetical protein
MKFSMGDILVPKAKQFPEGALVVDGHDDVGRLLAHPLGGGFQLTLKAGTEARFRVADGSERERALFRQAKFSLMDSAEHFTGWTNGENWNGWAMPHFEFAEAQRLIAWLKTSAGRYDVARDVFLTFNMDDEEEMWPGCSISISDGSSIKVYGIGAGCWCWNCEAGGRAEKGA